MLRSIHPLRLCLLFAFWLFAVLPSQAMETQATTAGKASELDHSAMAAYRAGDLATARNLWEEELADASLGLEDGQRARLCYNLGTLSLRESRHMQAVGWFTAALRLRPRDGDTWANLEIARLEAGLEAADRGDLQATVDRLLSTWTAAESSLLALLGCLPLALALGYEALRGGRRSKAFLLLGLVLWLLALGPWVRQRLTAGERAVLVIAEKGAAARAEPRADATRVEKLDAGISLPQLDEIPGWIEVQVDRTRRAWIEDEDLFLLNR